MGQGEEGSTGETTRKPHLSISRRVWTKLDGQEERGDRDRGRQQPSAALRAFAVQEVSEGRFTTVEPGDDAVFRKAVTAILDDLRNHPPGDDEFARAVKPILTSLDTQTNSNTYWEGLISSLDTWPGYRANLLSRRADFEA